MGVIAARRPLLMATAVAVLLAGVGLGATAVRADPVTDRKQSLDSELSKLRDDLEGTADDLVEAAVTLRRSQAQLTQAKAEQEAAQGALEQARRRDADLASRLALAQAEVDKSVRELAARDELERDTRATVGRLAREAYLSSGMSGLSIALSAQSPAQFADRMTVAGTALREQNSAITRLEVMQAETRARRSKLDAAQAQLTELKRQAAAEVTARKTAEQQAADAAARVDALVRTQAAAVTVISARKAAEQARLNALEAEQRKIAAILAARAAAEARRRQREGNNGSNPPPDGGGGGGGVLSYPARGPLTSPFGLRYHPILHIWRMHTGQDWGIPCGTPVRAAASGTVISSGWAGGYGNRVVIDHGWVRGADLATTYNHLTSIRVGSGRVSRGQLIGYSGTTGLSTGCHLHFEVLSNGRFVNPRRYF